MDEKNMLFEKFCSDKIAECTQKSEALFKDERKDEAVFEKIKANVYDIFKTVFSVAVNNNKSEEEAKEFFLLRMQQISTSWADACKKAEEHQDTQKAHVEQIKLAAAQEIEEKFKEIMG